jgi:hypothetical protein
MVPAHLYAIYMSQFPFGTKKTLFHFSLPKNINSKSIPFSHIHGYKIPGRVRVSDTKYPHAKRFGGQNVAFLEMKPDKQY